MVAEPASSVNDSDRPANQFRVTVADVIGVDDVVIKHIRIDAKPGSHARITSNKKSGGGLSASAEPVDGQPDQAVITATVLADHVQWKAGDLNALRFLMSLNGSNALMSDAGPMVKGKQLNDLLRVLLESGRYKYGTAVPLLRYMDTTFSLTVAAPSSQT